ncbi:hypothetical protein E5N10_23450 [Shigella flexneri]|uniref:Uncharacterized protein n=1 Tax=Shigella flexneri serotype 5a (strain M90T) TaxID=1086030 RepID=A0A4P7TMW3_SHIFM|nr:hypothetical protein B5690_10945 [Shigella flexneri 2a]AYV06516.1 hypothetical protein EEL47_20705 [Shigella flexneri]QCC32076.1 hypothetical protein EKN05_011005 [Shigella flexneri 5a str. M90T]EAB9494498.1 hypothetical protein [Shigella flexneri]EFW9174239.1 hypothetical protein [Shigella flexneri]
MTDFGGKTSIFSHPVYLFLRKFSLQDSRGGSILTLLIALNYSVKICSVKSQKWQNLLLNSMI